MGFGPRQACRNRYEYLIFLCLLELIREGHSGHIKGLEQHVENAYLRNYLAFLSATRLRSPRNSSRVQCRFLRVSASYSSGCGADDSSSCGLAAPAGHLILRLASRNSLGRHYKARRRAALCLVALSNHISVANFPFINLRPN